MALRFSVALLSGQEVQLLLDESDTVDEACNEAQRLLGVLLVGLVKDGPLDVAQSLESQGVRDGDRLVGLVDRPAGPSS